MLVSNLEVSYEGRKVIKDLSFELVGNKILSVVGESGIGKSTIIKCILGLIDYSGNISSEYISDDIIFNRRNIGYVVQSHGLLPQMTVYENIILPLKVRGLPTNIVEVGQRINRLCKKLNIDDKILFNKKPKELSGGESQRVAIIRALVTEPKLLLLDEPFSSLDPMVKSSIYESIISNLKGTVPIIIVTHDTKEAMLLSDEVLVLKKGEDNIGRKYFHGTVTELYNTKDEYLQTYFKVGNNIPKIHYLDWRVHALMMIRDTSANEVELIGDEGESLGYLKESVIIDSLNSNPNNLTSMKDLL